LKELDFLLIDVFADEPFGGSRLTLFPAGGDLPVAVMHAIAREMSPGETAFVLGRPGRRDARGRLRVFTPEVELPVAGHAMLGATFGLDVLGWRDAGAALRTFVWELEGGDVPITTRGAGVDAIYGLAHGEPTFLGQYFHRDRVAAALGLDEAEIAITGLPCEVISTGLPIHIVPVGSLAAIRQATLRRHDADLIARDLGFGDLLVFTCETVDPEVSVHCRMFAPHFGIPEDPASGVALGALAAYLVKHRLLRWSDRLAFIAEQGLEMGRPSRLYVEAAVRAGEATDISVGGRCLLVGRGKLNLP
jgi:trans-2,3-dihydro-3-hydroxyanthranilate isomerase